MSHQLHVPHTENHHGHDTHDDFLVRFKQNLWKETKSALYWFSFVFYTVLGTLFYGVIDWMFAFDDVKDFSKMFIPPLALYFVGQYLTLIPTGIVLCLIIASLLGKTKDVGKLLAVAAFFSFFIVFLI